KSYFQPFQGLIIPVPGFYGPTCIYDLGLPYIFKINKFGHLFILYFLIKKGKSGYPVKPNSKIPATFIAGYLTIVPACYFLQTLTKFFISSFCITAHQYERHKTQDSKNCP